MRWDVRAGDRRGLGSVLLDGFPLSGVRMFDTDAGVAVVLCQREEPGHGERAHLDPARPDEVCEVTLRGRVEFRP